jgi:hypothetical protein
LCLSVCWMAQSPDLFHRNKHNLPCLGMNPLSSPSLQSTAKKTARLQRSKNLFQHFSPPTTTG